MKINKYIIYILKLIFGIVVIYLIYSAIYSEKNLENFERIKNNIALKTYLYIAVVFLLQFLNWFVEAVKFRFTLKKQENISIKDSIRAVYIGNATSLFTPDRLGNFIGRFLYFNKIEKSLITSSTLLGNFTQLIATVTFALISSILITLINSSITIPYINQAGILTFTTTLWLILLYLYFNPKIYLKIIYKVKWIRKQQESINYLKEFNKKESIIILIYSIVRYTIFILQFYILLNAFGLSLSLIETSIFCGLLYLVTTLIPSPLMGNLGTREYFSIMLLSAYKYPEAALIASLCIWIINIAIPSLIGSYFLFKLNHSKI